MGSRSGQGHSVAGPQTGMGLVARAELKRKLDPSTSTAMRSGRAPVASGPCRGSEGIGPGSTGISPAKKEVAGNCGKMLEFLLKGAATLGRSFRSGRDALSGQGVVVQRNPGEAAAAPGIRPAPGWAQPWDLRKTGPGFRPRFGFDSNGNWVTMAILIGKLKICPPSHPVLRKPSH